MLVTLCLTQAAQAQTGTVRGFVTDKSDGQALPGASVALVVPSGLAAGTAADNDGYYALTRVEPGRYILRITYLGYEPYQQPVDLKADDILTRNVALVPTGNELEGVVVEDQREGGAAQIIAGAQTVTPREIERIPSLDVSGDLVRYLQAMPGIVTTGDRGGQLYIRGGEPSQNLVLLDGMNLYKPFHVLGFYSAFPSDILQTADVYAGGFGAKYSGRISSVIDVATRNGNNRRYEGAVSASPFVTTALVEGPVSKGRVSFLGSARVSTVEQVASQYVDRPLPYSFGDFFGKIHAVIADNHRVSFSFIHTYDSGSLDGGIRTDHSNEIRWYNTVYGFRYLILPKHHPILGEVLFSVSRLDEELGPIEEPTRTSGIRGFNLSVNVTQNYGKSEYDWGFFFRTPVLEADLGGAYQDVDFTYKRSPNPGAYFQPDLYVGHGLRLRPGLVGQLVGQKGFFFEPRFRAIWEHGRHRVSGAAGIYRQDVVGLTDRRDVTNIFTAWTDSPLGRASRAVHALLGYNLQATGWLDLSAEGYYKKLDGIYIGEWTAYPRFTTHLKEAWGNVKGLDLRLEIRRPNFYGFVNYGLTFVKYKAIQESLRPWFGTDEIPFRPPHDRRHQVNVLATTKIKGFDLSVRWNFGSGLPYTQVRAFDGFILMDGPVDVFKEPGTSRVIYDRPFGGVLPTYHRLDVSVDRRFTLPHGVGLTLQAGAVNVYDRANLFALDLFTLQRTDQLPFVPTVGLKVEF